MLAPDSFGSGPRGVGGSNPLSPTNLFNKLRPALKSRKISLWQFCNSDFLTVPQSAFPPNVCNMNRHRSFAGKPADDGANRTIPRL